MIKFIQSFFRSRDVPKRRSVVVSRCLINFEEFLLRENYISENVVEVAGGRQIIRDFIWFVRRSVFRDSEWPLTRQTNAVNSRCNTYNVVLANYQLHVTQRGSCLFALFSVPSLANDRVLDNFGCLIPVTYVQR